MANNNRISDELLAAFLDGNATSAEVQQVLDALHDDPELREIADIALRVEAQPAAILPMMQMAARSGENLCNFTCELYVLKRRGVAHDEAALLTTAREHRWLHTDGSPLHAMGRLLASQGLMVTHKFDATLADISTALELDNDVIVAVDNGRLYHDEVSGKEGKANHAVVVTAIDLQHKTVTIYDPEKSSLQTIGTTAFIRAWDASLHYMVRVLQTAADYNPEPIDLNDVTLTSELMELREAIAENAHDLWAATRLREGWAYGPERDDKLMRHPDLIPYYSLPESEKEYDRLMALNTIKLLKRLGYTITKQP